MDPRERLKRRYPGEDIAAPSSSVERLAARDRPLRQPKQALGEEMRVSSHAVRRNQNTIQPQPNAPLLKRLVRYPYALHATRPRTLKVAEPVPWDLLERTVSEPVSAVTRDARDLSIQGNPLRAVSTTVPRRSRVPSVDDWLGGRDG